VVLGPVPSSAVETGTHGGFDCGRREKPEKPWNKNGNLSAMRGGKKIFAMCVEPIRCAATDVPQD
jgi:hypothetical protein